MYPLLYSSKHASKEASRTAQPLGFLGGPAGFLEPFVMLLPHQRESICQYFQRLPRLKTSLNRSKHKNTILAMNTASPLKIKFVVFSRETQKQRYLHENGFPAKLCIELCVAFLSGSIKRLYLDVRTDPKRPRTLPKLIQSGPRPPQDNPHEYNNGNWHFC